jgi:tetratricopeptide (TPR) repeat protein
LGLSLFRYIFSLLKPMSSSAISSGTALSLGTLGLTGLVSIIISGNASAQAAPTNANIPTLVTKTARTTAVQIELSDGKRGSGVMIESRGGLYSIATNGHVVCQNTNNFLQQGCKKYDKLTVITSDRRRYQVPAQNISHLPGLDLALVKISSNQTYPVAPLGSSNRTPINTPIYTSGFPARTGQFTISDGRILANARQRLENDRGGYTMVYDADTEPGMSGGGVFNQQGQLVAIHGQGDRYQVGSEAKDRRVGEKLGLNRGIPLARLLGAQRASAPVAAPRAAQRNAPDELLIIGLNKFISPNPNDPRREKKEAIQALTQAIAIKPNYAQAYFLRGYIYSSIGNNAQALQDFNRTLQLDPTYVGAHVNRAGVKFRLKDGLGSLADFNRAIQLNPNSYSAYNNRGVLKKEVLQDYAGAMADFNQAIKNEPTSAFGYFNRALLKADILDDIPGALGDYDRAIELNPRYAEAYNNRGLLKSRSLQDAQGGLEDIERAIALDPENSNAYGSRGLLKYEANQDTAGALADYDQAITIAATDPDPYELAKAYNGRGFIKLQSGDEQGATADIDRAIAISPTYATPYLTRGLLRSQKSPTLALADFDRAIKLEPNQPEAYILRGLFKEGQLQDLAGAKADYDRVIQLKPKRAQAYRLRAQLKEQQKDVQGALQDYGQAIANEPKDVKSYFSRGLLKFSALNDPQGAIADFSKAIELNPKEMKYFRARSYARESIQDYPGAIADINQAIQLQPKLGALYMQRGYLRQQLKDIQAALADYNQAIQLEPTNALAYYNRGVVKLVFLKDKPGAIADYRKAADLAQQQGKQQLYENLMGQIKKLGG